MLKVFLGGIKEVEPTEIIRCDRPAGFFRGTPDKNKIDDTVGFVIIPSMPERFIRIYKKFYLDEVKTHLMTYGALSGTCANCKRLDLKLDTLKCPECNSEFKYIAFQNIRDHMPKMLRISHERPQIIFVDYDDFKRLEGEEKAKGILG